MSGLTPVAPRMRITATKTSNYTARNGEVVPCDASGGSFTVTLPAAPNTILPIGVKVTTVGSGTNTVTIGRNSKNIDGTAADIVLYVLGDYVELWYDGTGWQIVSDLRVKHKCQMYRSTAQSIANLTTTLITSLTAEYDVGKLADTTNSRITFRRAGTYLIGGSNAYINEIDDGEFNQIRIHKNGSLLTFATAYSSVASGAPDVPLCKPYVFAAGDYIDFRLLHNEGASINTATTAFERPTFFAIEL